MCIRDRFIFVFAPTAIGGYWLIRHDRLRRLWLTLASYVFYGYWDWRLCSLLLVSTVVDYTAGLYMHASDRPAVRRAWLIVSLCANLGLLGFFKYGAFVSEAVNALLARLGAPAVVPAPGVLLPVGISFYVFQSMSYTIDYYRGKIEREPNFIRYATFVSLFPQLVAGPIERKR